MRRGCWQHVDQDFDETDAPECLRLQNAVVFYLFWRKGSNASVGLFVSCFVVKMDQSSAFAELWHWMSHCVHLYVFCSFVVVVCCLVGIIRTENSLHVDAVLRRTKGVQWREGVRETVCVLLCGLITHFSHFSFRLLCSAPPVSSCLSISPYFFL